MIKLILRILLNTYATRTPPRAGPPRSNGWRCWRVRKSFTKTTATPTHRPVQVRPEAVGGGAGGARHHREPLPDQHL